MDRQSEQEFSAMRITILVVVLIALMSLLTIEWQTARNSHLQSMLEAEYAYDYACSQSSQIVDRAAYGRNVYISKTLYVSCEGDLEGGDNFMRGSDVIKSSPRLNGGQVPLVFERI